MRNGRYGAYLPCAPAPWPPHSRYNKPFGANALPPLRAALARCGRHLYENAIFFADKLVTLSRGDPDDVYRLAQAYVFTKQHRRTLHVLNSTKQAKASSRFRYLTAKCLAECQELDECLVMLDEEALKAVQAEGAASTDGQVSMLSAMQLLRGSVYESQENWPLAARCYTAALQADALCYEALDRLVNNHMISTSEQRDLLAELEPRLQGAENEWLLLFYRCKLDSEYGKVLAEAYEANDPNTTPYGGSNGEEEEDEAVLTGATGDGDGDGDGDGRVVLDLRDNSDMLTAAAEYAYGHDDFRKCYKLSCRVLQKDPFQKHVLPVHVCSMMRLDYHSELFYLAHQVRACSYPF